MERNNGQTIFLSVIGIATLLVAIIGATFAYFTTQSQSVNNSVNVKAMKVGSMTFTVEGIALTDGDSLNTGNDNLLNKVAPGWSTTKNGYVAWTESGVDMKYTCTFTATTNEFDAMYLYVPTEQGADPDLAGKDTLIAANTPYTIAKGTISAATAASTLNPDTRRHFTYKVTFAETGAQQNANSDKELVGTVECHQDAENILYYTWESGITNNNTPTNTTLVTQ